MATFADLGEAERLGIAGSYPPPLHELRALTGRARKVTALHGAEELARGLVTLPTHSRVSGQDLVAVADAVRGIQACHQVR